MPLIYDLIAASASVDDLEQKSTLQSTIEFVDRMPIMTINKKMIVDRLSSQAQAAAGHPAPRLPIDSTRIMKSMIESEKLGYVVICLYPDDEGYTISIQPPRDAPHVTAYNGTNGTALNIVRLSYEESDLLEYIDNEELAPIITDLIEASSELDHRRLFHCGCVIAEVKDYRSVARNARQNAETHFVLLRPTNQTVINDVTRLTGTTAKVWSDDDKLALEAAIVNATAEPLCLDPSPVVNIISTNLNYQRNWLKASPSIQR